MSYPHYQNARPASEDPLGDPADQDSSVLPASMDPLGDPADQMSSGENPYGDPGLMDFQGRYGAPDFSDQEAQGFYDRLERNPACQGAQCEYLAQMPPDDFQQHAQQAAQQLPPQQREEVAGGLLGALEKYGLNPGQLAGMLGMGSALPQQMGPQDLARLLGWAQQNRPDALNEAVADKPWFIKQLGNPVVQGILGNLARRFFSGR